MYVVYLQKDHRGVGAGVAVGIILPTAPDMFITGILGVITDTLRNIYILMY